MFTNYKKVEILLEIGTPSYEVGIDKVKRIQSEHPEFFEVYFEDGNVLKFCNMPFVLWSK